MVLFNYSTRELTAKIVYYGPGLCGKTTNLQFIHENLPGDVRGKMLSLATKTDRTLFFDFLPIDLGEIRGMKTRVQLYTVPGQVFYNETRKLVLKGADGIVFVADSQETMLGANVESFKNLEENLKAHGMKLAEMPHVIQFNKRDLPKLTGIEDLNAALNKFNAPFYESVATNGIGVQDTLKAIVKLVLLQLTRKYDPKSVPAVADRPAMVAVPAAPVPVAAQSAAPAPRVATPAPRVAAPAARGAQPTTIPVSPVEAVAAPARASAPPPPRFAKTPVPTESMPAFAEEEIDGLVDEVGDVEAPAIPEPVPVAAAASAPPVSAGEDDGIWLGSPEGEDAAGFADPASTYGSSVSIEDLLTEETDAAKVEAPEPAVAPDATSWRDEPAFGSGFEIDRGFDPEWSRPQPAEPPAAPVLRAEPAHDFGPPAVRAASSEDAPIAPFPLPTAEDEDSGDEVVLTEVANGDDLFNDPTLEIARLAAGGAREIIVPVLLGEGVSARRFKLAIRLRLEPVE